MPIVLRHNEQIEMNLAEYTGQVSLAELEATAAFLAANAPFLKRDTLSVALADSSFSAVPLDSLDRLFGRYKTLYAPLDFQMLRRSAWLCFSDAARPHIDYWIGGRDVREAMSTTLRLLNSYAEAGEWLLLNEAETLALQTGAGFAEIARFDQTTEIRSARAL